MKKIRIGTRSSNLALCQTKMVAAELVHLLALNKESIEVVPISTKGDQTQSNDLSMPTQPGFFVKEIEKALANKEVDIAVHSLKDLPSTQPAGLCIGAVLKRENSCDVICTTSKIILEEVFSCLTEQISPSKPWRIGTSSPRRRAMTCSASGELTVEPIRGNVETRLRKMSEGQFDAILLAAAGINRLNLSIEHKRDLPTSLFIPASGQAAIAIQCRQADSEMFDNLQKLNHLATWQQIQAEQSFMCELGASCLTAVGVLAEITNNQMQLSAALFKEDGSKKIEATVSGNASEAVQLGKKLAENFFEIGAAAILQKQ
jgi:hydroxymethylbilane synthase